jgi:hypothetical protein
MFMFFYYTYLLFMDKLELLIKLSYPKIDLQSVKRAVWETTAVNYLINMYVNIKINCK